MKFFKTIFKIYDQYTPKLVGAHLYNWKVLSSNKEEGWTEYEVESDIIDTSEWVRKGSIAIDCCFIHDDYRADGDMKLFVNVYGSWVKLRLQISKRSTVYEQTKNILDKA